MEQFWAQIPKKRSRGQLHDLQVANAFFLPYWKENRVEITMICLIVLEGNDKASFFLDFFYKIRLYENSEWIELMWTIGV